MAKHKYSLGRLSPSVTHTDNCRKTWMRNRKEMLSTYKFVYMFIAACWYNGTSLGENIFNSKVGGWINHYSYSLILEYRFFKQ